MARWETLPLTVSTKLILYLIPLTEHALERLLLRGSNIDFPSAFSIREDKIPSLRGVWWHYSPLCREFHRNIKGGVLVQVMELILPSMDNLPSFVAGIERVSTMADSFFQYEVRDLPAIIENPTGFLDKQRNSLGGGDPFELPNGKLVPRLPSINRWMWDGEVCGRIQLRWAEGTTDLPPYCLGHIGYGVFPWKRQRGYASEALRQILPEARKIGLSFVSLTTDIENEFSQSVIKKNGGELFEEFVKPDSSGGGAAFNFRIYL